MSAWGACAFRVNKHFFNLSYGFWYVFNDLRVDAKYVCVAC